MNKKFVFRVLGIITFMFRWFNIFFKLAGLAMLAVFSVTGIFAAFFGSPWVPARKKDFYRLKNTLKLEKDDVLYELGAGDGRVSMYLAKNTEVKKIVAIELSFFYFLLASLRIFYTGLSDRVAVIWGDFFRQDIHEATKVFFYLTPQTSNRLSQKLLRELKNGVRVVTYRYPLEMWQYREKDQPQQGDIPLYVYIMEKNILKWVV